MEMLICDLPYNVKKRLCWIFDLNENWRLLINLLHISDKRLKDLQSDKGVHESLTSLILDEWSTENHTVGELFYQLLENNVVQSNPVFEEAIWTLSGLFDSNLESLLTQIQNVSLLDSSEVIIDHPSSSSMLLNNDCDYHELKIATSDWSSDYVIGSGGFGIVYKGYWKGNWVAIKKFNSDTYFNQLINELQALNVFKHDHVLPLYSYSVNGNCPCLVYQMMNGGSLECALKNRNLKKLKWRNRLKIIIGVCRGLHYLHTFRKNQPLVHGDIKPANVLLDNEYNAKIGDFGLSILLRNTDTVTVLQKLCGTKPYLPADFLKSGILTPKIDVFSFGIMLLEMVTNLKSYDSRWPDSYLKNHLDVIKTSDALSLIDDQLISDLFLNDFQNVLIYGFVACSSNPDDRPNAVKYLNLFENMASGRTL